MSFITKDVLLIVRQLEQGKIVGLPTETVYGLAADYSNLDAIQKIFTTKQRPENHPLILHVLKEWDLSQWVDEIPVLAHDLIQRYWPGSLSIVFKTNPQKVSPMITGGQQTVAIRAPNHPLFMQVLQQFGKPLVAPSANMYEQISPTTAEHVKNNFIHTELAILQGGRCRVGMESTIIYVHDSQVELLRPGSIEVRQTPQGLIEPKIRVSGQHKKHYQPQKPFYYFESLNELPNRLDDLFVMGFQKKCNMFDYCFPDDISQIYYEFYYQIQSAEHQDCKAICIELPPDKPVFHAIRDKILKASKSIKYCC
jgi:L-threonylcarbamoyladenylate synthase